MPNRCVAAGCGNMTSDSVSLFLFPKDPNLCGLWTRQAQQTQVDWKPACRLLRRNSRVQAIDALLYNVTVC